MKPEYDFSQAKRGAVIPQTGKTRITTYSVSLIGYFPTMRLC